VSTPRVIRPHARVFKLGKHIKIDGKRIPKPLINVACCVYRMKDRDRELGHVAENEVSKEHAVLVARGIDQFIVQWLLLKELISDRELQVPVTEAPVFRYYAGGSVDELRAALEAAGFFVTETIDPLGSSRSPTRKAITASTLANIERYLDLSSLDLVLERVQSGRELLHHASGAQYALSYGLQFHPEALLEHLEHAPWTWHPELRDMLLVLFGKLVREGTVNSTAALMERLPAATDPSVSALLESWGLPGGRTTPPPAAKAKKIKTAARATE
jgi:hypothetical protein